MSIVCYCGLGQVWVINGSKSFAPRFRGAKYQTFFLDKIKKKF